MNIAETLALHATRRPNVIAVRSEDAMLTYARLWERVTRLAHGFRLLGLEPGAGVLLLTPNRIEGLEVIFAAALAGAVSVPVNHRLAVPEIAAIARDCQPTIVVTDAGSECLLPPNASHLIFSADRFGTPSAYESLLGNAAPASTGRADTEDGTRIAQIKYTSGTSGEPKGALISHQARVLGFLSRAVDFGFTGDDVFLLPGPLYGGFGTLAMLALYLGATVILPREFSPRGTMDALASGEVTVCLLVPTMYEMIFDECPPIADQVRAVRMMLSATAPLHARTRRRILKDFGPILHEFYGTTEAGVITHATPDDHEKREGTIGLPLIGVHVRVIGEASGDAGELCVAGPDMFDGYLGRPADTAAVLRNGWYATGDIARVDSAGFVYLVDRKKELIISGGQNISPLEVERVLFSHPAVREAVVIGVPDRIWGEALVAVVVADTAASVTPEELIAYCAERLAHFKKPKAVRFVSALPRDPGGKVQRRAVRAMFASYATHEEDRS